MITIQSQDLFNLVSLIVHENDCLCSWWNL